MHRGGKSKERKEEEREKKKVLLMVASKESAPVVSQVRHNLLRFIESKMKFINTTIHFRHTDGLYFQFTLGRRLLINFSIHLSRLSDFFLFFFYVKMFAQLISCCAFSAYNWRLMSPFLFEFILGCVYA